jgi:hypothetical protein
VEEPKVRCELTYEQFIKKPRFCVRECVLYLVCKYYAGLYAESMEEEYR